MAERNSSAKALRRYGPIALVVALIVGAILIFGGGGDKKDTGKVASGGGPADDNGGLPLTFQEAKEQGKDIDFGPQCDKATGRVMVPVRNAAPCIAPFTGDNGGATSPGVTATSIKIVLYQAEPDPLQQALVQNAGADTDPVVTAQEAVDYIKLFADVYETYGRTVDVQIVPASGGPADATAAQADARKIIDMKPFAVIGGPGQTDAFWQEITAAKIICTGTCAIASGWDEVDAAAPYLWPSGLAPEQADAHLAELVGKQLVGKPAAFAGDPSMRTKPRVFGWVQAETKTDQYKARNEAFDALLKDTYGGEIATRSTYLFDPAAAQETATTVVARMRDAGVTTVILSVDPLIPKNITEEATKQGYFPEWVVGPSVLADTTFFGRTFDQKQWANAIGLLSLNVARAKVELSDSYAVYDWYYGKPPPTNTHAVVIPGPERLMLGIHLAGPNLTPQTFEQGLFRYPPRGGGKTFTYQSWGTELWGRTDHNSSDDAGAFWWDATATGEDETGRQGTGMMQFVDGGTRYLPGKWPTAPLPFFDKAKSVTVYDQLPPGEELPDYPPWPGSPAAG